jgi:hypothetical protein
MKVGRTFVVCLICGALALVGSLVASGTSDAAPVTNQARLERLSLELEQRLESRRPALYYDLLESDSPPQQALNANPDVQLMYMRESGLPVFYILENINAARTLSTDEVWPGGSGGFSLTGSTTSLGELCEWDAGGVRTSHQEFGGRVTQMDSPSGTHYHSTHVAGTATAPAGTTAIHRATGTGMETSQSVLSRITGSASIAWKQRPGTR